MIVEIGETSFFVSNLLQRLRTKSSTWGKIIQKIYIFRHLICALNQNLEEAFTRCITLCIFVLLNLN